MFAKAGCRKLFGDQAGSTALEFAVVLPLLAVIFAGLAQFAWTQHCASSLRFALSTASRALMLNPSLSQSDLQSMVKNRLAHADPNVTVALAIETTPSGRVATLDGAYDRSIMLPLLPSIPIHYRTTVTTALPAM